MTYFFKLLPPLQTQSLLPIVKVLLKVGMHFFKNRVPKQTLANRWGRVPKQTLANQEQGACLLMMRGESALQCTWWTLSEPSDDRKIEMADKKEKRKTSAEQKKAYTVSTPDATKWPLKIIWHLCQYVTNRMQQQFTFGDLSCHAAPLRIQFWQLHWL